VPLLQKLAHIKKIEDYSSRQPAELLVSLEIKKKKKKKKKKVNNRAIADKKKVAAQHIALLGGSEGRNMRWFSEFSESISGKGGRNYDCFEGPGAYRQKGLCA